MKRVQRSHQQRGIKGVGIWLHVGRYGGPVVEHQATDKMSRIVRKPDFCLCENKGADQLRSNCEADQRLCFRYSDSTIPLLLIAKISSL